ncbi:MAG: sulfurtransferase [Candidatus Tectomicrobia bacterium]|nr:sulfurtransferase [Candidatus Tectomicrobia bacterium]
MEDRSYANPSLLFTPQALHGRLGDPKLLVIDVRPTPDYVRGHIAGAVHFDLYGISLNDTRPGPLAAFMWMVSYLMAHRGVDYPKTVVFYEDNSGFKASRGFWFLEYFGHEDAHVLDGGLSAWKEGGFPLSAEPVDPVPTKFDPATRAEGRIADADLILKHLNDPRVCILDTRSDEEYTGKLVRSVRGGAIPKAVHIEWKRNLDAKGRYKSAADLKALYEARGVTSEKIVIPYCQGGYRAAHAYLALRLIGYPHVRNYVGSWKEWGDREDLPIETPSHP